MRERLRTEYPSNRRLNNPSSIADTISLEKLQDIRCNNDHGAANGYRYADIGNDDFIAGWTRQAAEDGFLSGWWQADLEAYARMERGPANQILMDQLHSDESN